jgi:hypothetical protein
MNRKKKREKTKRERTPDRPRGIESIIKPKTVKHKPPFP